MKQKTKLTEEQKKQLKAYINQIASILVHLAEFEVEEPESDAEEIFNEEVARPGARLRTAASDG